MKKGGEQLTQMINGDGVLYQLLPDCIVGAKSKKREQCTEVTFGTRCADVMDAVEGKGVVGIILWVPRNTYDEVLKGGA